MNNDEYNFNLKIMMAAGHPKREAERHLKNGSIVFYDFEENFDDYMDEWYPYRDDEDTLQEIEDLRKMIKTKIAVPDWDCVEVDGKWYYIEYCL